MSLSCCGPNMLYTYEIHMHSCFFLPIQVLVFWAYFKPVLRLFCISSPIHATYLCQIDLPRVSLSLYYPFSKILYSFLLSEISWKIVKPDKEYLSHTVFWSIQTYVLCTHSTPYTDITLLVFILWSFTLTLPRNWRNPKLPISSSVFICLLFKTFSSMTIPLLKNFTVERNLWRHWGQS